MAVAIDHRCEGSGKPTEQPAHISGSIIGLCPVCKHTVLCTADGHAAGHDNNDPLRLF